MVNLKVDTSRIKVRDLVEMERGNRSIEFMRDLISRFVIDESGAFVEREQAINAVDDLSLAELQGAIEKFSLSLKAIQEDAVNPTNNAA